MADRKPTVVDVVPGQVRILRVVYDEGPAKPIAVLRHVMAVIPERPCAKTKVQPRATRT